MRVLYTAGEFFFDLIFYQLQRLPRMGEELVTENFAFELGGGAVTTAITAAKLGRKVELATVIGTSALDRFALEDLSRRRVGLRHVRQSARKMGGLTVAVSLRRDRFFLTSAGANAEVEKYQLSRQMQSAFGGALHVHFALRPRRWRPFSQLLLKLQQQGVTTSWDLGWHPAALRDRDFQRAFSFLSVVFLNQLEALRYSRSRTLAQALRRLQRQGQILVVKLGEKGAIGIDGQGKRFKVPALPVKAADTTGAGDAFNGGFLHLWLNGAPLPECLRAGNICGSLSTRLPGGSAGAPEARELARWLRKPS